MGKVSHTKCATCGGTGHVLIMRSWFRADGFTRSRCAICSGTGLSSYRPDPGYARFQSNARTWVINNAKGRGLTCSLPPSISTTDA